MEIVSAKTDLKDLRFLLDQELQYLTRQVLMGVVLSDRDSPHGMRFEDVFISNELIAYMLLHRIAHCVEDAEGMGQRLLDAGVFEAAVDTPNSFRNHFIPFYVNEEHESVRTVFTRVLDEVGSGGATAEHYRFEYFFAKQRSHGPPRALEARALEGWLEKKNRLGIYQRRYFRILPGSRSHREEGGIDVLSYFNGKLSIEPHAAIPLDRILLVERSRNDPRSFRIRTTPGCSRPEYIIRAPSDHSCLCWVKMLQRFARKLSPRDIIAKTALASILTNKQISDLVQESDTVTFKKGQSITRRGGHASSVLILQTGRVGVYDRPPPPPPPRCHCRPRPQQS
mmetsp:Transcript_20882/g.34278  ORF Transcript_20882/g.34278 Transcript_20882/m.34278 type:complete len:339 (+) Transcript_20882:288-1304(+)